MLGGGEEEFYPNFSGYKNITDELDNTYESLYNFILEVIANDKYYRYYKYFYYISNNIPYFNFINGQEFTEINSDKIYFYLEASNYAFGAEKYTVYYNGLKLTPDDGNKENLFQSYGNNNFLFTINDFAYPNACGKFYGDSGDDSSEEFYYTPILEGDYSTSTSSKTFYGFKSTYTSSHAPSTLYIRTNGNNFIISETKN